MKSRQGGRDAAPEDPRAAARAAWKKVTPARRVAFEILTLVGADEGHSDELLRSRRMDPLSAEDRNLATALVMGVLRWQIALDARIQKLLTRPGHRLLEPVAIALRMGAFQLLHMDRIPAHAALSESVELCRAVGQPQATGMVNAVLRKIANMKPDGVPLVESVPALATRLGHPVWLVERWAAEYGRSAAAAVCEYDQREPGEGELFLREARLPEIDDGSRLVAELAVSAAPAVDGRALRVWDCCAAPGGKTLVLAARLGDAEIIATDVSARRMEAMRERMRGFDYAARVRSAVMDALKQEDLEGEFDLILCDVPCSGTGTLARNPEIRLKLSEEELTRQAERQKRILTAALDRLAPGGRLLYSTCSLEPEENERIVEEVSARAGVPRIDVTPWLARLGEEGLLAADAHEKLISSAVRGEALRTLPGVHPCDGFYAALFERTR